MNVILLWLHWCVDAVIIDADGTRVGDFWENKVAGRLLCCPGILRYCICNLKLLVFNHTGDHRVPGIQILVIFLSKRSLQGFLRLLSHKILDRGPFSASSPLKIVRRPQFTNPFLGFFVSKVSCLFSGAYSYSFARLLARSDYYPRTEERNVFKFLSLTCVFITHV